MTHYLEDIETYREQAYEALIEAYPADDPRYEEISDIIEQQILEDLEDYANSFPVTD
jgi:CHASE3 domain sensor protein